MKIQTAEAFEEALKWGPYTSVGSYPLFFLTENGEPLSYQSAKDNMAEILDAFANEDDPQWRVTYVDINWENAELYCSHSGERIESAYAEPEEV